MQDEVMHRRKLCMHFTGILGFKERRQRNFGNGMERRLTAKKRKLDESQARKGIRRMPRRSEAKKDAASCEKPWGAAGRQRTMDIRMGQPGGSDPVIPKGRPDPAN